MPAGQIPPLASSVVAVVRNGNSHSFSRHLQGSVGDKVLECIRLIEIHRQLCQAYGLNIMSKQTARRWCRQFSEGRQSVHDEDGSRMA
ncbi:hypothetical protein TNCV_3999861 [Trichonephila clavipes]|nr:hypothetical protein TNCV_3999861 [Trichonephila clavipes]